jgi:hypothetical protein
MRLVGCGPKLVGLRSVQYKGDCFAKAHLSTAQTPARQDARIPFAHEDRWRPQGACGAPQEGPSSAHSRIARGAWIFRARRGWCGAESLTQYTGPGSADRIPTSQFLFARTNCRTAVLDSASRRHSAARCCAIASGGACGKSCAAIVWRYLQDGTSSYTRRAMWRSWSLRH